MQTMLEPALQEFSDRIRAASAARSPLRIRGGGSKDFYGEPMDEALPVLDTRAYAGIVSYEPSELVITVRAGTPLAEVEAVLAEKKQCLAFEPPHFVWTGKTTTKDGKANKHATVGGKENKHATVGGMVASGLSGPARATAGSVRDYVLGARLMNGLGQDLHFGGTVMKNVAGYDVSRLMAGSLGCLALITEVSLKVLPTAPREATLRFTMDEATAIQQLNTWAGQPLPLNASSWVIDNGTPSLYLRLRGAVAAVEAACEKLSAEHGGERVDSPETTADWSAARELQLPWFKEGFERGDDLWRLSVPQTTAPLKLSDTLIDWLGGQRWLFAPASERISATTRIREAAAQAGGHATLFIANNPDSMRANPLIPPKFDTLKPPIDRIHRQLKAEFDPAGIFNPGRMGMI
jgi:glycolate oxidase FAD binding subunit